LPIEWIFFDMGGVLVDDEQAMLHLYRRLREQCLSLGCIEEAENLLSLREDLIGKGEGRHWVTAIKMLLGEDWRVFYDMLVDEIRDRYTELNVPFPGVGPMLSSISGRYGMGLLANQPKECRSLLEAAGWMEFFRILGISHEIGLHKPQPEFFQWALDESGADPDRCIMVGDRIDNDIVPAKAAGMHTIWFRMEPDYETLAAGDDFAKAYAESRKRAGVKLIAPADDSQQPDFTAYSAEEVIKGIEALDG
jgi:HAD superfamily hydrolase (TIGR01509 family)